MNNIPSKEENAELKPKVKWECPYEKCKKEFSAKCRYSAHLRTHV